MRLIDADALTDFLKCLFPARGMWEIEGDTAKDAICETVVEAMEMVKNMETIKPRPKGKWIDEGFYADGHGAHAFRCSECGGHIIEYDPDPFCRWCGADMRPREEEQE